MRYFPDAVYKRYDKGSTVMVIGSRYRFAILIVSSITIALILVFISVSLYFSSGTAQLDLSRPGYQSVRDQSKPEDPYKGFSASGPVTEQTLSEFSKLYSDRAKNATSVDAFNSEVLSDAALGLDDVDDTPQN